MTLTKLLTGRTEPLTAYEFNRWRAYYTHEQEVQAAAQREANRQVRR